MFDVITIGSALIDIFVHSDHFESQAIDDKVMLCQTYGDKVEVESLQMYSGGGAGNTAVGFRRMGFNSAIIAELGRDAFADVVIKELEAEEVTTNFLIREKKEQTGGSVILVGKNGGRTVLVHRGASSQLDIKDVSVSDLSQAHWLHLSSIGGQLDVLQHIFRQARANSVGLSWNPGKAELQLLLQHGLPGVHFYATLFFVNQEEWESIAPLQETIKKAVEQVIVTNGAKGGIVLLKNGSSLPYQALPVVSVDDTGAGDAFGVGYVSAYLLEKEPLEAVMWGTKNAASVVQRVGAKPGLLTRAQVAR